MAETTITFKVLGMTCTMCALTIEKELSDQEGVTSANVNFALGRAIIKGTRDLEAAKSIYARYVAK